MDTATASVSKIYDAQEESELVLQRETEAISQVSQSIKQSTNSNPLIRIRRSLKKKKPKMKTLVKNIAARLARKESP